MFWLIFIWFFLLQFVIFFKNFLQNIYWISEQPSILYIRKFAHLGFLEKLFLSLFYRDGFFENSVSNLVDKDSIYEYRQKNYPKIFCYYIFMEKIYFEDLDLNDLEDQFDFLKNSIFFKKFIFLKNKFDLTKNKVDLDKRYKNNFIFFLVFQDVLKQHFLNNIDFLYFDEKQNENYFFYIIYIYILLLNCNKKIYYFNLSYYSDWYKYTFSKKLDRKIKKPIFSHYVIFIKRKLKKQKKYNFMMNFYHYHLSYKYTKPILSINGSYAKSLEKLFNNNNIIIIFDKFKNFFSKIFKTKFKDSSNLKNIQYKNLNNFSFFFIRKNRIFNKGRYSRNRQLYRTGVYWCLWLNIIIVYSLYFLFYRFSFNFGYIWIGMFFIILSTIFSRASKYNFFNIFFLKKEAIFLKNWFYFLWLNFFFFFEGVVDIFFHKTVMVFVLYAKKRKMKFQNNYISYIYLFFFEKLEFFINEVKKSKRIYIWEIMLEEDDSIFKYRTFFHVLKQIYKSITY